MRNQPIPLLLIITALALTACSAPETARTGSSTTGNQSQPAAGGDLRFKAPERWVREQPTSSMRVAQYVIPRVDGDGEDGSLIVYYFGGQGGSIQANLDRWIGQMEQADGSSSKDKAKTQKMTANGLDVTLLDVSGTFTAEMSPGSGTRHNKTGFRMRAAVVETPRGPYFAKLVGPEKTIVKSDEEFNGFVRSFEFKE